MSHDRGCYCGKERWDFEECYTQLGNKCGKSHLVECWMDKKIKNKALIQAAVLATIGNKQHEKKSQV